jgi:hypothetical protein
MRDDPAGFRRSIQLSLLQVTVLQPGEKYVQAGSERDNNMTLTR